MDYVQATHGPPPMEKKSDIVRPIANFHPSVWGDHFLSYPTYHYLTAKDSDDDEEIKALKEEVKKILLSAADKPQQQLKLIDDIQRLGLSYHFEPEIDAALNNIYVEEIKDEDDLHIHNTALRFRLLRQHGLNVSSDVFTKFKDTSGIFKECLIKDVGGMLSLYEATQLRVHGEDVLEEALAFTTYHLERLESCESILAGQVIHALKVPIIKGLNRVEARRYISIYEQDDSHNEVLLKLAKLDFNYLQKLHQGELSYISRWWKDLNFKEKLPFVRDRLVEDYFWILGIYFEPQHLLVRRILTKLIAMISAVDDIYDAYGTLDELLLFSDAIERWDIKAVDELPEYIKPCYRALLDVFGEMEDFMVITGKPLYRVCYAKDKLKELVGAYLLEAKWLNKGYIPTLEEYMENALVSCGYICLGTCAFVGMGDVATREAFDWVSSDPLMVKASSVVNRLSDDIVGHEVEQKRGHVASSIECYVKHSGVSKEFAIGEFKKQIINAWKDMNKECLNPTVVPMPLLTIFFNFARVMHLLYMDGDLYTHSKTSTKELITSVLVDPISI